MKYVPIFLQNPGHYKVIKELIVPALRKQKQKEGKRAWDDLKLTIVWRFIGK